jgi:hypothetical protein
MRALKAYRQPLAAQGSMRCSGGASEKWRRKSGMVVQPTSDPTIAKMPQKEAARAAAGAVGGLVWCVDRSEG